MSPETEAEVERLRGVREATVQAVEDAVTELDIEDLAAYDVERVARVACAAFRVDEVERLRGLLGEALDLLAEGLPSRIRRELGPGSDGDRWQRSGPVAWNIACWIQEDVARPFVDRIRREAGLS